MSSDTEAAIERVGPLCRRCRNIPTEVTNHSLNNGYCLVCWDRRQAKEAKAAERAIERFRAIQRGTWYVVEKQGSVQAKLSL